MYEYSDTESEFDISWIEEHEKINHINTNYSREPMHKIQAYCVYVNKDSCIEKVNIENIALEKIENGNRIITKEQILHFIQTKKVLKHSKETQPSITRCKPITIISTTPCATPANNSDGVRYKLQDILLYNIELESQNIQHYSQVDNYTELSAPFFKVLNIFDEIVIPPSIFVFHSINALYFIFKENNKPYIIREPARLKPILKKQDKTKKHVSTEGTNNHTKKVTIQEHVIEYSHNKTHKHQNK